MNNWDTDDIKGQKRYFSNKFLKVLIVVEFAGNKWWELSDLSTLSKNYLKKTVKNSNIWKKNSKSAIFVSIFEIKYNE